MAFSIRDGRTRAGESPAPLPRILGLAAMLFLLSVLDPVVLLVLDVSALFLFLAREPAWRGVGLVGIVGVAWIGVAGEGLTPVVPGMLGSTVAFAAMLRYGRHDGALRPAVVAALAAVVVVPALFAIFDPAGLAGWQAGLSDALSKAMDRSLGQLQAANVFSVEELVGFRRAMRGMVSFLVVLIPAAAFINLVLANALGARIYGLFRREGRPLPPMHPLEAFSFSDLLVWGLIAGLVPEILPLHGVAGMLLLNVLVVVAAFYLLRGLAVGLFWLRRKGLSTFQIGAIYTFLFLVLPPACLIVLFLPGLLDTWFDFRSLAGAER